MINLSEDNLVVAEVSKKSKTGFKVENFLWFRDKINSFYTNEA